MGHMTTGLSPSSEPSVSRTNVIDDDRTSSPPSRMTRTNGDPGDDRSITGRIRDFMKATIGQDNVNLQPEAMVRPGAVRVGSSTRNNQEGDKPNLEITQDIVVADLPIVAHLAPDEADIEAMLEERWAAKVAQEIEDRTRQELDQTTGAPLVVHDDDIVVVADEVKDVYAHPCHKKSSKWIMAILLFLVVGGVAAFLLLQDKKDNQVEGSEALNQTEDQSIPGPRDPLLEELRSWIIPTTDDLLRLLDPTSPQSRALAWVRDDPITRTPGRLTRTVLERYVLAVLYYSTSGPSWKFDYLSDEDVCTWNDGRPSTNSSETMVGVYCVENGETVGTLALSENNLRGTLPWELALLTSLEVMDFGCNSLTGSIPTRISELTNLQVIIIFLNSMTGPIPADISKLTRLEVLWACVNRLTGTLPATFSPFTVEIDLGSNSLTGSIPESWGATMPALEQISLHVNRLTGSLPSTFGRLSNLHHLSTSSNLLSGPLPTTFPASITALSLDNNTFTGYIPSTWGTSMPNLFTLSIANNSLTGTIPSLLFTGMTNLEYFAAGDNFLSGPLPESFPASISDVYLQNNTLTGPVPSAWGDILPNLGLLAIHGNSLTGSIPVSLGQIPSLRVFTFNSNSLTGSVDFLCDMEDWASLEADCPMPMTCSCCTSCHAA